MKCSICGSEENVFNNSLDFKPKCMNCIRQENPILADILTSDYTEKCKPMTNREWLNGLSDEEFAKEIMNCGECAYQPFEDDECKKCINGQIKWLNQEHKEVSDVKD